MHGHDEQLELSLANESMTFQEANLLEHQAKATQPLRNFLYRKIGLPHLGRALDVGCGPGTITAEIASRNVKTVGVDVDPDALNFARQNHPEVTFELVGKGDLPFSKDFFDLTFCHFVLMWQQEPEKLVSQMVRVTKPGGWFVVAAEPDYEGRISFPNDGFKKPLIETLQQRGADPFAGRKLRKWLSNTGLRCESGVWPSAVESPCDKNVFDAEWEFYRSELKRHPAFETFDNVKASAQKADRKGERFVFLPIIYAIVRKN